MPPLAEIPVVFHIVQKPNIQDADPQFLSDEKIKNGLDQLNVILQGIDPCTQQAAGENTDIQLCLAQRTIFNTQSAGIRRYESPLHLMDACTQEQELKELIYAQEAENPFPSTDYINIWIVDDICAQCHPSDCDVVGFASFPADHGGPLDGLVIELQMWHNPDDPCNFIKAAGHEIGHYFGLYHTFQGGCQNISCHRQGDRVCDTPPDANYNIYPDHPCLQGGSYNSCSTDGRDADPGNPFAGTDVDDLHDNLMDYAPIPCLNAFTAGQVERMHHALLEGRSSLLSSAGCQAPCPMPISYQDIRIPDTLWVGEQSLLQVLSSQNIQSEWNIWPDQIDHNGLQLNFTPTDDGLIRITLQLRNGDPNCLVTIRKEIIALCPIESSIVADQPTGLLSPGTMIRYRIEQPTHQPGYRYIWQVNGIPTDTLSTPMDFSYTLGEEEFLDVRLIVSNSYCQSASNYIHHRSTDCQEQQPANVWPMAGPLREREDLGSYNMDFRNGIPQRWDSIGKEQVNGFAISAAYDIQGDLLYYFDGTRITHPSGRIMIEQITRLPFEFEEPRPARAQHLVVPMPHSQHLFYLLKPVSAFMYNVGDDSHAKYALVDMRLNNGEGAVIESGNIDPQRENYYKMDALRHCNGHDWWIIMTNAVQRNTEIRQVQNLPEIEDNSLYLYLLDEDGFHFVKEFPRRIHSSYGRLRFAPGGRYLSHYQQDGSYNTNRANYWDPAEIEWLLFDHKDLMLKEHARISLENNINNRINPRTRPDPRFSPNGNALFAYEPSNQVFQYRIDAQGNIGNHFLEFEHSPSFNHRFTLPGPGAKMTGFIDRINAGFNADPFLYSRPAYQIRKPNDPCPDCGFVELASQDTFFASFINDLPINLIHEYTYGEPHGIYGVDTVTCGDTALVLTTDACPGRQYDWSSTNGAQLIDISETGEMQIHFPYAGPTDFFLEKVTQCRSYFDTLHVTVLGDCEPVCQPPLFDIPDLDTLICRGEAPWIEWRSNADSVSLIDLSNQSQRIVSDPILALPPVQQRQCFELRFHRNDQCDTSFSFCIQVQPPLQYNLESDVQLCQGQELYLDITTDADRIDLINDSSDHVIPDIQPGQRIAQPLADSCYRIRLQRDDGCDQFIPLCVQVHPQYQDSLTQTLCQGDTAYFQGRAITQDTSLCVSLVSAHGCDSIRCAQFAFRSEVQTQQSEQICRGDSVLFDGQFLYQEGEYQQRYTRSNHCDSIHVLSLSVIDPPQRSQSYRICQGDSLYLYGQPIHEPGEYRFTQEHPGACDSLIQIQLTVHDTFFQQFDYSLCTGDSVWVVQEWIDQPGVYPFPLVSEQGCDSVIIAHVQSVQQLPQPDLQVDCQQLQIIAQQAVPDQWHIQWSNGDTLHQTQFPYGNTQESLLLIRDADSAQTECQYEIQFALPPLPDSLDIQPFLSDTQSTQGTLILLDLPLNPTDWQIQWQPQQNTQFSCDTCLSTQLRLNQSTLIQYQITHRASQCSYEFSFMMEIIKQSELYIPNAFSPNGDDHNDLWEVFTRPQVSHIIECQIYNRWGGQVAQWSDTPTVQWDGTHNKQKLNPGVFTYFVRYQLHNGTIKTTTGDVTILK